MLISLWLCLFAAGELINQSQSECNSVLRFRWTSSFDLRVKFESGSKSAIPSYARSWPRAKWCMKLTTAEWVAKAEADFASLERECRARKRPNHDGACFHAQQCAEKFLKARLAERGIEIQKVHNLLVLLDDALPFEPLWEIFREDLAYLSDFAVSYRYPGESATRKDALEALRRCRRFREDARSALGLQTPSRRRRRKRK